MASQKVAILYGIGEGDYHGRAFVSALKEAGFEVVREAKDADIVVTHSGGCFFLPPLNLNQKFVLINPVYWPRKPLLISMAQKVARDFMDFAGDGLVLQWLRKTAMNIVHLIRYAARGIIMTVRVHTQRFFDAVHEKNTIIIRNDGDTFLHPHADELLEKNGGRKIPFFRVPGQHDTCWRDPEPYINLMQKFAKGDL